ncbi:MAG: response regulator [Deltaproteobacteria bacterium]|nr:response regulator [Deltaproteobacteria bacterium]
MIKALILCDDKGALSELAMMLEKKDTDITWVKTGSLALSMIVKEKFDLLIIDESLKDMTGIDLVKKVVAINPTINCVIASKLSPKNFHRATEGLGVLMQLPLMPSKEDAEKLLSHLNKVLGNRF